MKNLNLDFFQILFDSMSAPLTISISNSSSDEDEDVNGNATHEPPAKKFRVNPSVHKHFQQKKDGRGVWTSKCLHCDKEKIYKHKNASSLQVHLKNKHPAINKLCVEEDNKARHDKEEKSLLSEHQVQKGGSSWGHTSSAKALFPEQKAEGVSGRGGPMDKFVRSDSGKSLPEWKQKRINRKFAFWLGASGLPISAVTEDSNFREFIAELNPEVKLPSRSKVMKDCTQLTKEVQNKITDALGHAKKVSITVDIWSSTKCKNSYMGITSHLFNHQTMRRESYRIACRKFDEAHTGENIAKIIKKILVEYKIEAKVLYCLSDNGSNMKKGLRIIDEESDDENSDTNVWDAWEERFEASCLRQSCSLKFAFTLIFSGMKT